METFDKREWRRQGGMTPHGLYLPTTSTGRHVVAIACRTPRKGEVYLKPSGVRGIFNVLVAQQDFARRHYTILRVIKGRASTAPSRSRTAATFAG
jgi:hypothetical protein